MNQESASATGRCPYPDCGATVNLGKKFCKTCGRPIHGVAASPPPVAEQPPPTAQASPAPATSLPEPTPPETGESDPSVIAPSPPPGVEAPPPSPVVDAPPPPPEVQTVQPSPDPAFMPPQTARQAPQTDRGSRRVLFAASGIGLVLIMALGYWFMRPKATQVAEQRALALASAPAPAAAPAPPVPSPIAEATPAQPPPPPAEGQSGSNPRPQQNDALRLERERLAAERKRLELAQQEAREQEQRHQQELAQRQQESEAQQRALAELKAKQEEQQRQIDEGRRKLVEEQARRKREAEVVKGDPTPPPSPVNPPAPVYRGPRFGEIVWEGTIKGTDLITIENGRASSGTVTGNLPGVAVLIQPTDTKKVSIASSPGPRNQYRSVVFRVSGNGNMRVTLKWSLP
jgi:hypothetical protein